LIFRKINASDFALQAEINVGESMSPRELIKPWVEYFAQKDYERAACYFKKALELDVTFIAAYSALAETLNRMGEIDQAMEVVQKWLEFDNNDALAHATISRIYVQLGQIEQAEKELAISKFLSSV